uniref:Transposase domain-containing protein n=2 Tax=Ixodes scapularis TaxID=6945 RepID=A0A1S4M4D0_IXOSC
TEFESSEANEFDRADLQPQNIPESSIRYEEKRNCEDADVHESIVGKLRSWALDTATPHRALTELLKILQTHSCFASIRGCARSLLKTPRKACVEKMGAGKYCHFGVKEGLDDTLKRARFVPDVIKINVNIDGLPLTKSTRDQFWPVLCHVTDCGKCDPFPIGVYYGKSKAVCAEEFLRPAVSDIIEALSDGLIFKGRHLRIELSALICDAPAKSYVLGIKGHNGYFSCTKCQTGGDFLNGRMCFPQLDATLRTDGSFRSHAQEEHHLQRTELEKLPIDLVKNVPLDYMHLVCLGVVSKLLRLWLKGDSRC